VTRRAKYRKRLPQLDGGPFLTDGGLETTLIFHEGWDLPCFAAFLLLDSDRGRKALRDYFRRYIPMAIEAGAGSSWKAQPGAPIRTGERRLATAPTHLCT
jgi:homocysteine S-methyltransferase